MQFHCYLRFARIKKDGLVRMHSKSDVIDVTVCKEFGLQGPS